jgi:putative spermidine/putrescine transport system substrate-binding protein
MRTQLDRREMMLGGLGLGAAALSGATGSAHGQARSNITGVTWGGIWLKAAREAAAKQQAANLTWALHEGPTVAIVAKIRATWPRPQYDFVIASAPTLYLMMRENWLEPLTPAAVPHLPDMDSNLTVKNDAGAIISAPLNQGSIFWIYDDVALGMKIEKQEDLLSPRMRGKLLLTPPGVSSAMQLRSLAMGAGGGERDVNPGFEFIKQLAKAKTVGALARTDVDIINAFTTGACACGFVNISNYAEIKQHNKNIKLLNKVPGSPTFKHFVTHESIMVLKREGSRKPVMDFVNVLIDPAINTEYARTIGAIPGNLKATVDPTLDDVRLKDDTEQKMFGYYLDHEYTSRNVAAWNRRWELEIVPLLT